MNLLPKNVGGLQTSKKNVCGLRKKRLLIPVVDKHQFMLQKPEKFLVEILPELKILKPEGDSMTNWPFPTLVLVASTLVPPSLYVSFRPTLSIFHAFIHHSFISFFARDINYLTIWLSNR